MRQLKEIYKTVIITVGNLIDLAANADGFKLRMLKLMEQTVFFKDTNCLRDIFASKTIFSSNLIERIEYKEGMEEVLMGVG